MMPPCRLDLQCSGVKAATLRSTAGPALAPGSALGRPARRSRARSRGLLICLAHQAGGADADRLASSSRTSAGHSHQSAIRGKETQLHGSEPVTRNAPAPTLRTRPRLKDTAGVVNGASGRRDLRSLAISGLWILAALV